MQVQPHNLTGHELAPNQCKLKVMVDGRVIEIEVNNAKHNLNKTVNLSHEIQVDPSKRMNVRVTGNSSQKNRVVVPVSQD